MYCLIPLWRLHAFLGPGTRVLGQTVVENTGWGRGGFSDPCGAGMVWILNHDIPKLRAGNFLDSADPLRDICLFCWGNAETSKTSNARNLAQNKGIFDSISKGVD